MTGNCRLHQPTTAHPQFPSQKILYQGFTLVFKILIKPQKGVTIVTEIFNNMNDLRGKKLGKFRS